MDFPELLEDDEQANQMLGTYLSSSPPGDVLQDQNLTVNPLGTLPDSGTTGITPFFSNTGTTEKNDVASITNMDSANIPIGEITNETPANEPSSIVPKTLKIPAAVHGSLEKTWSERGFPSFHGYCIAVLSRHLIAFDTEKQLDELRQEINKWQQEYDQLLLDYSSYKSQAEIYQKNLADNLTFLNSENQRLQGELQQVRMAPTQTLSEEPAPVLDSQQSDRILHLEQALTQYAQLVQVYNTLVFQVCKLASAESSRTPEFFFNYFEQLSSSKH